MLKVRSERANRGSHVFTSPLALYEDQIQLMYLNHLVQLYFDFKEHTKVIAPIKSSIDYMHS